jgi:hypothetical protein
MGSCWSYSSEQIVEVANPGIQAIAWSPLGSHLLSWQRPQKDQELGNLIVWKVATGEAVARFNQKTISKDVRNPRSQAVTTPSSMLTCCRLEL